MAKEQNDKQVLTKKSVNRVWGMGLYSVRITRFKSCRQNIYDKLVINLYVVYGLYVGKKEGQKEGRGGRREAGWRQTGKHAEIH